MSTENIKVSTRNVNDPQAPNVSSSFDYDIPDSLEEAQKRFPPVMENGQLVDPVYMLWRKQFVVAIQAPSRLELARQWEKLPVDERLALMVEHVKDDVVSYTAELPEAGRRALQSFMANWKLGERTPRVRVEYVADPVAALAAQAEAMNDEQRAEMAERIAKLLGLPVGGRRR